MKLRYVLLLWFALGAAYLALEGIWRGWTHGSMIVVGGLCALCVGAVNQFPRFYKLRIVWQSLIGAAAVLLIEFASGCVLNLWWGWEIWDYTGRFGNVLGQICIQNAALWVLLMPFAIWAEDTGRWLIYMWAKLLSYDYREPPDIAPYTLRSIYREFLTGR